MEKYLRPSGAAKYLVMKTSQIASSTKPFMYSCQIGSVAELTPESMRNFDPSLLVVIIGKRVTNDVL